MYIRFSISLRVSFTPRKSKLSSDKWVKRAKSGMIRPIQEDASKNTPTRTTRGTRLKARRAGPRRNHWRDTVRHSRRAHIRAHSANSPHNTSTYGSHGAFRNLMYSCIIIQRSFDESISEYCF